MKNLIKKLLFIISIILFFYSQNTFLEVTNYIIINDKIHQEFNSLKIIQISDYHNTKNKVLNKKNFNNGTKN